MSHSVRRRVASNTAVQVAGKGAVLALGAVSIAVLTRYLGPSDYGKFTLALMYMQLFAVLADAGLYMTVVREISKAPERTEELVGNALTLRLLLTLALIGVGAAISLALPYESDVRVAIVLAGAPLLFGMLTSSLVTVPQARLRMDRAVIGEVAGRAFALGLTGLVAALDLGFYAVFAAAAGGTAAQLVVTFFTTRSMARIRFRGQTALWRPLLVTSVPLGLALAINELYFRADTLIISLYEPYDEVGLYTLAYRILEFTLALGTIFLSTTFPLLSEAVNTDEPRARRLIQLSTDLFVILALPLVTAGLVLAPHVIEIAGGSDFEDAAEPLRILLFAGALSWVNGVFGFALIAKERQKSALWLNVTGLTFNVGLNFLLVPRYGIVAAAIVTVASEALILAGSYRLMRRNFDFFPRPTTLLPALVAAAAMGAALWALEDASIVLLAPLAVALYAGLLYAISPRSREVVVGIRGVSGAGPSRGMPRGVRDTRSWYRDTDPMSQVDPALVEYVAARAGRRVLDLGSGLGGYTKTLADRGFEARGLDVSEEYVEIARGLGVQADSYDGGTLPLDDDSVDTVILIEVIEHLEDPGGVLAEAARVATSNVLVTTPNCTQDFEPAPIEFTHMLDADHRQFFTVESLSELMAAQFERSEVEQSHPLDEMIVNVVMPRPLPRIYRTLARAGKAPPRFYSRLLGQGWVGGAA